MFENFYNDDCKQNMKDADTKAKKIEYKNQKVLTVMHIILKRIGYHTEGNCILKKIDILKQIDILKGIELHIMPRENN